MLAIDVAVGLAACLAFLLPANTAPNAIVYEAGYFTTGEMMRVGFFVIIAAVFGNYFYVLCNKVK
ncbi:MAG: hypothetical protein ACOX3A_02685 [bacterium]